MNLIKIKMGILAVASIVFMNCNSGTGNTLGGTGISNGDLSTDPINGAWDRYGNHVPDMPENPNFGLVAFYNPSEYSYDLEQRYVRWSLYGQLPTTVFRADSLVEHIETMSDIQAIALDECASCDWVRSSFRSFIGYGIQNVPTVHNGIPVHYDQWIVVRSAHFRQNGISFNPLTIVYSLKSIYENDKERERNRKVLDTATFIRARTGKLDNAPPSDSEPGRPSQP